jgi:hypothetical protein
MNEAAQNERGRTAQVMAAIALLAALAACALAIVALSKKAAEPAAPKVTSTVSAAEVQALKAEVANLHGLVAKDDGTLVKISTCLPELTAEINGLTVEDSERGGFVTSAFLHQGKQISTYCSSTLEKAEKFHE